MPKADKGHFSVAYSPTQLNRQGPDGGTHQVSKKDISIRLTNESGSELLVTWNLVNAFPVKLLAPAFDATTSEVAVEELDLMADSVTIQFH